MKHAVGDDARNTRNSSLGSADPWSRDCDRRHDDNGCHGSFRLQRFRAAAVDFPVLVPAFAGVVDLSKTNFQKAFLNLLIVTISTALVAIITEEGFFRGWLWGSLVR